MTTIGGGPTPGQQGDMNEKLAGLLFDAVALALLATLVISHAITWEDAKPWFALVLGARASVEGRKLLSPPPGPPAPAGAPEGQGQAPPKAGGSLSRLAHASAVVALLVAVPTLLLHRGARS